MIITPGRQGEQLCWSGPWTRFSARTLIAAAGGITGGVGLVAGGLGGITERTIPDIVLRATGAGTYSIGLFGTAADAGAACQQS